MGSLRRKRSVAIFSDFHSAQNQLFTSQYRITRTNTRTISTKITKLSINNKFARITWSSFHVSERHHCSQNFWEIKLSRFSTLIQFVRAPHIEPSWLHWSGQGAGVWDKITSKYRHGDIGGFVWVESKDGPGQSYWGGGGQEIPRREEREAFVTCCGQLWLCLWSWFDGYDRCLWALSII